MKNTQMLRPNRTPATAARRKSARLGHLLVTATTTNNTPEAIHMRQNDKTTPDAWVDLPNTPPNDQNPVAARAPQQHRLDPSIWGQIFGWPLGSIV